MRCPNAHILSLLDKKVNIASLAPNHRSQLVDSRTRNINSKVESRAASAVQKSLTEAQAVCVCSAVLLLNPKMQLSMTYHYFIDGITKFLEDSI